MNSTFTVIALAIVAVAIVWLVSNRFGKNVLAKRSRRTSAASGLADRSDTQWRAVKIAPGLICCGAAGKLTDKIFLSKEAPQLPLDGCTEEDCRCKYVHLEDRRSGGDRRIELGELGAFLPISQAERRQQSGRRSTDLAA